MKGQGRLTDARVKILVILAVIVALPSLSFFSDDDEDQQQKKDQKAHHRTTLTTTATNSFSSKCHLLYSKQDDDDCPTQLLQLVRTADPTNKTQCRPNYFIAGTRKGGTTSLHTY